MQVDKTYRWIPCLAFLCLCCGSALAQEDRIDQTQSPFDALYEVIVTRQAPDGQTYGHHSATPLLWSGSSYLLNSPTHARFMTAIDRFAALSDEELSALGDVRRAVLQRHLWTVFDWATVRRGVTFHPEPESLTAIRYLIQRKVASLIKRLALPQESIDALPNAFREEVKSNRFPGLYDSRDGLQPFLPRDLFDQQRSWVCLDVSDGELPGMNHSLSKQWRSAFLVFMKLPGGREPTLAFIEQLNDQLGTVMRKPHGLKLSPETPQLPVGTQFALVEQPMLINDRGQPTLSPMIYDLQIRATITYEFDDLQTLANRTQGFAKFVLNPINLMSGKPAVTAVGKKDRHYLTFFSNDPFEGPDQAAGDVGQAIRSCFQCHTRPGTVSFLSRNRTFPRGLPRPARLSETTPQAVGHATAARKRNHYAWGVLEALWRTEPTNDAPRSIRPPGRN